MRPLGLDALYRFGRSTRGQPMAGLPIRQRSAVGPAVRDNWFQVRGTGRSCLTAVVIERRERATVCRQSQCRRLAVICRGTPAASIAYLFWVYWTDTPTGKSLVEINRSTNRRVLLRAPRGDTRWTLPLGRDLINNEQTLWNS